MLEDVNGVPVSMTTYFTFKLLFISKFYKLTPKPHKNKEFDL